MKVGTVGLIVMTVAAVAGGGYKVSGAQDFSVEVRRPASEVYSAFSGVMMLQSGARAAGFVTPKVSVSRPSDRELIFSIPSARAGQNARIALKFEPGKSPSSTLVTSAIDVPPVEMVVDGSQVILSEDKVENEFRRSIAAIGKRLDQHSSTTVAQYEFRRLIDMVALAANPDQAAAYRAEAQRRMDEIYRTKANLEAQGYHVADPKEEYETIREERMKEYPTE